MRAPRHGGGRHRGDPPERPASTRLPGWRAGLARAGVLVLLGSLIVLRAGTASVTDVPVTPGPPPTVVMGWLYVSPDGSDTADGSVDHPLRTIQAALDRAGRGTVITLAPGVYHERLSSVRDGAPGEPITIKGPETGRKRSGRYRAVLYGTGRIVSISHSYLSLQGFTIDGQEKLAERTFPTTVAAMHAFKDGVRSKVDDGKLIYIGAADTSHDLTGIKISNMFLNGSGGECVRLRNNAHDNTIADSVIQYCGMFGKGSGATRAVYHNGEGVYIGTSPRSVTQPMHRDDASSHNLVTGNLIRTFGSECFDVKENAHDNVFEGNQCSANTEPVAFNGSNIELRGYRNIVRDNTIADSAGANIKIGADKGNFRNGGNVVERNRLSGSTIVLLLKSKDPQGAMCGNVVEDPRLLAVDDNSDLSGDITVPC